MRKINISVSIENLDELDELFNRIQVQLNELSKSLKELYEFKIQVALNSD